MRNILTLVVVSFVVFCGWLVIESGLFQSCRAVEQTPCILLQQTVANDTSVIAKEPAVENTQLKAADFAGFTADHAAAKKVMLGSIDPAGSFKFQLELSSKGAAVRKVTFSEFDDRDYKDPQPLVILSPVLRADGSEILSMASTEFVFVQQGLMLRLDGLHWKSYGVEKNYDGSQTARFEAIIKTLAGRPVVKLTKTYKVAVGSYLLDCKLTAENLTASEQKVRFNLAGPIGIGREAVRADMRKVMAGFRNSNGQITSTRLDVKKLHKAKNINGRRLIKPGDDFLWAAVTSKYFTAILVPLPDKSENYCDWVRDKTGRFYNPDGDQRRDSGDETVGLDLKIAPAALASAGQANSTKAYDFHLYIGPKDKTLFDKNELYRELGFVQTIDFMACCCPASIISPLAFGILAIMKWMYSVFANYGVVIIILVFLVRLCMHPITKRSQISMSKFTKVLSSPEIQEIRKKYAKNQVEMNKRILAFQKERGISPATPITGMLPMFVQMPIWIALWSAIYASIELRGAAFLPFWITDLSVPDALFRFSTVTVPMLGWKIESLNLLPILMGVAFYLQQKLMPSQAAANPQAAQQQKMMMIMMPLLFPLMLYKAPSGVNLYIMASTFAGVIEQYVIRKHIREKEQTESQGLVAVTSKTGGKRKKKNPKPFYKM